MKPNRSLPYFAIMLTVMLVSGGCSDDDLFIASAPGNPDAITFSAYTVNAVSRGDLTRSSEQPLYEPLVLTDGEDATPLYLHTFETNRIGFEPGEEKAGEHTRGLQVNSAADLVRYGSDFAVLAQKSANGAPYLGWSATHVANADENIWHTDRTEYWPGKELLSFYAVSPSAQLEELKSLYASRQALTFIYSAQKSGNDMDAEAQPDLLLAATEADKNTNVYGRAPLGFHHALSAVKFAIRDVMGGEVVNIKISGVRSTGTCFFDKDDNGDYSCVWRDQYGEGVYSQNFNFNFDDRIVDPDDPSKDIPIYNTMPHKTFMMIPQSIPENAEIIITLKRTGMTPELKTVKGKIVANGVNEWRPGHEYVYTISTSKDNWVRVFEVKGNSAEGTGNIYVYSPNDERFTDLQNTAYYSVKSYRYRANNRDHVEDLPWDATFEGSEGYEVDGNTDKLYPGKFISSTKWITDLHESKFSGSGGTSFERHDIEMYPHYLMTDWEGDKRMQTNAPYKTAMTNKKTPYDLSTFGGTQPRSTANTYVIDRGGWYSLPLYYGNSVVKGATNTSAYTCKSTDSSVLKTMTDYKGNTIGGGGKITNATSASLVWEDAYNMVSEVELVKLGGENMLRFYVDKENLQQGNSVVAVKDDAGDIIWSWHIWATEHWLDENGLPNAISNSESFAYKINPVTLVRESGDSQITHNQGGRTFYMSPYNLGWCDPKNVIYLKRKSTMIFVQYLPDKSKQTDKVELPVIQQGETVNYKIGNNTYYQFGRKDPQVGFVDRQKNYKANFGPTSFKIANNNNSNIQTAIKNPHVMYVHTGSSKPADKYQDWTNPSYINLWNNSSDVSYDYTKDGSADLWNQVKTIYDPCPVGYVVPNAGVWRVLAEKADGPWGDKAYPNDGKYGGNFHGERERKIEAIPDGIYVYILYGTTKSSKKNYVYLIPTGNRWYSNGHVFTQAEANGQETTIKAGLNFNLRMFYGWSSRWTGKDLYSGYAGAIGIDAYSGNNYFMASHFIGRRAMGRPVRPIRDPNF